MPTERSTRKIKSYCCLCCSFCPIVVSVENGIIKQVAPDWEHPCATDLCPKGLATPELVYSPQRLRTPLRRTNPKSHPDPGWEKISWDEALTATAEKLNQIKKAHGAEAVVVARPGIGGSSFWDAIHWLQRLRYAFGTPNIIGPGYICQWHRDTGSSYTYGKPGVNGTIGAPDFERSSSIVIWGFQPHVTDYTNLDAINKGVKNGAKLIVIDPRRIELVSKADLWLKIKPSTDGVLAMSMIHVLIERDLYDKDFTLNWTTGPFLVRTDSGDLLKGNEVRKDADPESFAVINSNNQKVDIVLPGVTTVEEPVLEGVWHLDLADGKKVECKTVFSLLKDSVRKYSVDKAEGITGIPREKIIEAVELIQANRPFSRWTYNGIEQNINAMQTNRAINIFYALVGDYDKPGGNIIPLKPPTNAVAGKKFMSPKQQTKCLGYEKRPLGPAGISVETQAYEVYSAILEEKPYPVKAMVGFGGNLVTSAPLSLTAKKALEKLDFHVHADLFLTPTAALADIVLPVASPFETWHAKTDFLTFKTRNLFQYRPEIIPPLYESWPDLKIIFQLAKKLGLGDKFWEGDIEAAMDYHLAPANTSVKALQQKPGGIFFDIPMRYQKYREHNPYVGRPGLSTPSGRVELYSQIFKNHGHAPLPDWNDIKDTFSNYSDIEAKYPLTLLNAKTRYYCHGQQRALPSLRAKCPYPYLEIHSRKAQELSVVEGDWLWLETMYGKIKVRTKISEDISYTTVCTQHGWWQECSELGLPGFDPYSSDGSNVNLLYSAERMDPITGCLPIKGFPCNVTKV